jgi:hypothetical protein
MTAGPIQMRDCFRRCCGGDQFVFERGEEKRLCVSLAGFRLGLCELRFCVFFWNGFWRWPGAKGMYERVHM